MDDLKREILDLGRRARAASRALAGTSGARKNVATLRTVRTLINNLIIGVTKGFKYKMRYVYAHFPINVNVEKNNETGLFEVEIR